MVGISRPLKGILKIDSLLPAIPGLKAAPQPVLSEPQRVMTGFFSQNPTPIRPKVINLNNPAVGSWGNPP